jgi:beta-galactosidase
MKKRIAFLASPALMLIFLVPRLPRLFALANEVAHENLLAIDARHALDAPAPTPLGPASFSPDGHSIALTNRYLLRDGRAVLPVMGEFQYSRYPAEYWEEELLKMKAGGVEVISTYVFWIHHEEIEGEFDFSGNRDLRRFAELCKKHGLLLVVRIGPYVHGEARNGGLPDWVIKEGPTRRNDPLYLSKVRLFYEQIGKQLRGELWKNGGPVIGVQVENEYFKQGPDAGAAHIAELKKMAIAAGLDVPLYTVTGWGNAAFPAKEVVPVFGVYPDAFWESSLQKLPANEGYTFSFRRDLGGITIDPDAAKNGDERRLEQYPYFLAEAGGGMQVAYHRRPVISADDVAALFVTHVGAGANLYGYYVFHGESNPIGKRTTMQESAAVDGVYDLPVISYDFQAPLGEFGQVRTSYRILKEFHLFLHDFGSELASAIPVAPAIAPKGFSDFTTPRYAARVGPEGGFLFFNNYVREYPMAEQKNVRVAVKLAAETLTFPRKPFDVATGAYFIWPFHLEMNGVRLRYATAQLLCKIERDHETYYFFFEQRGIAPEFGFDGATVQSVKSASGTIEKADENIYIGGLQAGTGVAASLTGSDGRKVNVVLLSAEQAQNTWKARVADQERVVVSAADVYFDGDTMDLRSRDRKRFAVSVFPPFEKGTIRSQGNAERDGIFTRYSFAAPPAVDLPTKWAQTRTADPAPPANKGKYNAVSPEDADFARAAEFKIAIPNELPEGCSDVFLDVRYQGDIARIYRDSAFLGDNFFDGQEWDIGLKRFLARERRDGLTLKILPLRKDAPIFLEPGFAPDFSQKFELSGVENIKLEPEYELRIPVGRGAQR